MTFPLRSTVAFIVTIAVLFTASLLPSFGLPLLAIGIVLAATAIVTGVDWSIERVNHHRHEHARASVEPYTRFANSLRSLPPSTVDTVMRTMSIRVRGLVGEVMGGSDQAPILVVWSVMLPDKSEMDVEFIIDYLRATAAWQRDDPTVGNSMWAVNWHTKGERPAALAEYTDLEGRISRLTAAFVTWGLAERGSGPYPAQLLYSVEEIMDAFGV